MRKIYINESGFGSIELILIIVFVAIIGATGWVVYNDHHKSPKVAPTSSKTVAPNKTSTNNSSTSNGSNTNKAATLENGGAPKESLVDGSNGYLVISEWGVEIPESNNLTFDYYPIADSPLEGTDSSGYVWLSSVELDNSDPNCLSNSETGGGSGGVILRYTPTTHVVNEGGYDEGPASQVYTSQTPIGGYYYEFEVPQYNCQASDNDGSGTANKTIYSDTVNALKSGAGNIQLAN